DYDLDIPPTPAGSDSVSDFLLRTHTGFCEHFASALTIMCRTQGIPARLVTGYAPGNFNPFTGLWEVRLAEAHSWTEIYVRKIGWVPLDATPGGMDVYEPQEAASLFTYVGNLLDPLWKSFINSPFCAWLESAFKYVFAKIAFVSFSGAKYVVPTLAVSVVLATLLTVMRFLKFGWSFPFAWGRKGAKAGDERQQILQEASKEFLSVSKSLAGLGIERKPYETSEDLLTRVKEKLLDGRNDTDEFVSTLSNFMDEYSSLRFGSAGESERLRRLSQSVDKMAEELAQKRKTELVFK
ncbi:MAG: transglutaminase-like domain-containing protein, partial [Candidatus Obscuribacterales bacterium]|nr:transglutaminase-like domain-containing protein [Candidatus Obscuribacterales bacterium]